MAGERSPARGTINPIVMPALRVILDETPSRGTWNMAVDEALLEGAATSNQMTLRWYAWRQPTISLGYFQALPEFTADDPLHGLDVVRRLSGGGAILHHHEWTYSCVLPAAHPLVQRPTELYTVVHEAIIDVVNPLGATARLRGERSAADEKQIFLCFLRGDPRDVVLKGHKVVGSAQRRRGGAVLQHGSVLLTSSPHAPHQPGLRDLGTLSIDDLMLRERLAQSVAARLLATSEQVFGNGEWRRDRLNASEMETAREFEAERYSRLDWKAM